MNLYQELNKSLREYKLKESISLKEAEENKKQECDNPTKECDNKPIKEDENKEEQIKILSERLTGLQEALVNSTDIKEKEKIQEEINTLKSELEALEAFTEGEDEEEETEDNEEVSTEEVVTDEPVETTVEDDINDLVKLAEDKEDLELVEKLKNIINKLPSEVAPEEVVAEEPAEEVTLEDCDKSKVSDLVESEDPKGIDEVTKSFDILIEIQDLMASFSGSFLGCVEKYINGDTSKQNISNCYLFLSKLLNEINRFEQAVEPMVKLTEGCTKECDTSKEDLTECEVTAIRVLRESPSNNAFLIEAETPKGFTYLVGKNYNSETKILEEAETFDNKSKASEHFKKLLGNK